MHHESSKYESTNEFAQQWLAYRAQTVGAHECVLYPKLLIELGDLYDKCVLDLGCGEGSFLQVLAEQFPSRLVGIEINAKLIEEAKSKFPSFSPVETDFVCLFLILSDSSLET